MMLQCQRKEREELRKMLCSTGFHLSGIHSRCYLSHKHLLRPPSLVPVVTSFVGACSPTGSVWAHPRTAMHAGCLCLPATTREKQITQPAVSHRGPTTCCSVNSFHQDMLSQKAIYRWQPTNIYLWQGCGAGVSYGISIDDLDQRWICVNKFSILPLGAAAYFIFYLIYYSLHFESKLWFWWQMIWCCTILRMFNDYCRFIV